MPSLSTVRWSKVCFLALSLPIWSLGGGHAHGAEGIRTLPLVDQDGAPISLRGYEGRTLVLHFIFTHCLTQCHLQVRSLRTVREALPADTRARVTFLSVSIDPQHDTPETLRRYAQANGIIDPDWRFASASADVIDQLTRSLGVKRQPVSDGQFDHTLAVFLFDARGRLLQRYAGADVDTARLAREIGAVASLFGATRSSHETEH